MSDIESDEDLKRFLADEDEDNIKPIDLLDQPAPQKQVEPQPPADQVQPNQQDDNQELGDLDAKPPLAPPPAENSATGEDTELSELDARPPLSPPPSPNEGQQAQDELADPFDPFAQTEEQKTKPEPTPIDMMPAQGAEEGETADALDNAFLDDPSMNEEAKESIETLTNENRNIVKVGDFYQLNKTKPGLKRLRVGCGWDVRRFEGDPPDLDLSMFLLDKNGKTRVDEDFVFFNNESILDGAIQHMGDSRTGAGEGDDEMIMVDLNAIPFDVMKISFILSVYDQDGKGDNLQDVKNVYWRVVDEEDRLEVVCFPVPDEDLTTATGMLLVSLVREGPEWFVDPKAKPIVGGLAKAATTYDIIVQEVMSTEFDDEDFEDDFDDKGEGEI